MPTKANNIGPHEHFRNLCVYLSSNVSFEGKTTFQEKGWPDQRTLTPSFTSLVKYTVFIKQVQTNPILSEQITLYLSEQITNSSEEITNSYEQIANSEETRFNCLFHKALS